MMIIPMGILQRVFFLKQANSLGSCLGIIKNGISYLITARHIISDMKNGVNCEIEMFKSHEWVKIQATPYFPDNPKLDLALLKTNLPLAKEDDTFFTLDAGGLILGQDVAFLGFPLPSFISHPCVDINKQFSIPFVKRAIVSSLQFPFMYLDGHNNPGFSGGPVVFYDNNQKSFKICGIVSSYIKSPTDILINNEVVNSAISYENTGIFVAHHIKPVKDLIDRLL